MKKKCCVCELYVIILTDQSGTHLLYCDCDGIIWTAPEGSIPPVPLGYGTGQMRPQITDSVEISSFYSFGAKMYCIGYKARDNSKKCISRLAGISLDSHIFDDFAKEATFNKFLQNAVMDISDSIPISQVRKRRQKGSKKQENVLINVLLSNNLSKKRIVKKDFSTVPYGY